MEMIIGMAVNVELTEKARIVPLPGIFFGVGMAYCSSIEFG
jgi:hypothetical protein